jgi:S-adenosylmethionine decarboxylase
VKSRIWEYSTWVKNNRKPKELKEALNKLLKDSGFSVLNYISHTFNPEGYTCALILAESHLAVHTFPENNNAYIQLSSCNEKMFDTFLQKMERVFEIDHGEDSDIRRFF